MVRLRQAAFLVLLSVLAAPPAKAGSFFPVECVNFIVQKVLRKKAAPVAVQEPLQAPAAPVAAVKAEPELYAALAGYLESDRANGVLFLDEVSREKYRLSFRDGKAFDSEGNPFDTSDAVSVHGEKRAIVIQDELGNWYASKYSAENKFHHTTLSLGRRIRFAGEMEAKQGIVTLLGNHTGHYKLPAIALTRTASQLHEMGVDHFYVVPYQPIHEVGDFGD